MEKIKFLNKTYELVANGYQLQQDGGRTIFQPGEQTFEEIEAAVSAATSIMLLEETGAPLASRTDLVYAGRLTKQKDYVIRTEKEETGTDEDGNPVYTYKDVTGTVMIAEFRLPDLREAYKSLEEEVTNTQMALVELYEGGEA
ncbi:hypothetical protein [Clostridium sp. AF32-12BH]|uniref:hypothetical protein n=1 Tax=Clostridium sp. AF32-12BH TaxID=2292006 RepID=UPI000E46C000|nr:hypothetical protein [Clostridium sp. AF32-12BH]RHP46403.1 hypothetical protein DWZ40_10200 [Clostridium sp. AF32-12BH]